MEGNWKSGNNINIPIGEHKDVSLSIENNSNISSFWVRMNMQNMGKAINLVTPLINPHYHWCVL